jgi:hypothetical protein
MEPISQATVIRFLQLAGERLTGDWVIVGGSVLPLLGVDHRVTLDIDLASYDLDSSQRSMIILMDIARDIGLPVEAINQAAAYFLEKIPNWRDQLVVVQRGKSANFFRPNLILFLRLKLARLSESDLADCLEMLRLRSQEETSPEACREVLNGIRELALKCSDSAKRQRYDKLELVLQKLLQKGRSA